MPDIDRYLHSVPAAAIGSIRVWKWLVQLDDKQNSQIYMAHVDASRLIFANDPEALKRLVKELTRPQNLSKIADGAPEWRIVSRYPYWGYRRLHFRARVTSLEDSQYRDSILGAHTVIMLADLNGKVAAVRIPDVDAQQMLERKRRFDNEQRERLRHLGMAACPSRYAQLYAAGPNTLEESFSLVDPQAEVNILNALGLMGFEIMI